jgi:hypothetical protein
VADTTKSAVTSVALVPPAEAATEISSFPLREVFGVTHPVQVVELEYQGQVDEGQSYMEGPDGAEVPYQVLSNGHLLVLTGLPAWAEKQFRLMAGRAPGVAGPVKIVESSGYYEVTNGLTGVRVAKPAQAGNLKLAPIQGIRLKNGVWTATGPNVLTLPQGTVQHGVTVTVKERGSLQATLEVAYSYDRPAYYYGSTLVAPAGAGVYRSAITLKAGQASFVIEEDADTDLSYSLNVQGAVQPNQLRYRGHHATQAEFGREADGRTYRPTHERNADSDAVRDVPQDKPVYGSYTTGDYGNAQAIKRVLPFDRWASNGGWYWLLYNAQAAATAPVVGFYAGRNSVALGVVSSGPAFYSIPGTTKTSGIQLDIHRRGPDARTAQHVRFEWGIFVGTKGQDLGDMNQVQTIQQPFNINGGINLTKVLSYQTSYGDPTGGWGAMYMTGEQAQAVMQRVRTDSTYYSELYTAEPTARPLLDAWRDGSGAKAKALADEINGFAARLLDTYVNGNGTYDRALSYWMGGLEMSRRAVTGSALLAGDQLSAVDREKLKASLALFANILWDNDSVPLQEGAGVNMGGSNMITQQMEYRHQYTLLLAHHPLMGGDRVQEVAASALADLQGQVNDAGAQHGSPHYSGAAMGPLVSFLQQMKVAGQGDAFRDEPKLARYAEFFMNLQTPVEVRFGGLRKLVSVGDGSTEGTELYGQMATAFGEVNQELSQRLMQAWEEGGKVQSGFHGTTVLKIDERLPSAPQDLRSATFPGYYSVLRHGFGTPEESAMWVLNGNWYNDHRHDDGGSTVLYALGAPLSIDWGSMYSPQAAGAYLHSLVLPETAIGRAWDADKVPLGTGVSPWKTQQQEAFEAFQYSTRSVSSFTSANGTKWTRTARMLAADPQNPVIVLEDSFSGPDALAPKVWSMNLMAQGEVETPQGMEIPPMRLWSSAADGSKELPSAGPVQMLAAGWNRYRLTGQWKIDWDLYTYSDQPQEALLGNWSHDWHPNAEQGQFRAASNRTFRERQNFLRRRSSSTFTTLIHPFAKESGPDLKVSNDDLDQITITGANMSVTISQTRCAYQDHTRSILTASTATPVSGFGIQMEGGPGEIALLEDRAVVTLHGPAGQRRISLPEGYQPPEGVQLQEGMYLLDHEGPAQAKFTFTRVR